MILDPEFEPHRKTVNIFNDSIFRGIVLLIRRSCLHMHVIYELGRNKQPGIQETEFGNRFQDLKRNHVLHEYTTDAPTEHRTHLCPC